MFNDTDNRGGLSPVALPATNSQGDAGPVDQQPDDDLGVDPSLLGIADLAQLVLLLGLEVERGDARRHSDTSPAAMACFRGLATDGLAVAALDAAAQGSGTKACPVLCVSVLQVGVDSVGVGGGGAGPGPCIWSVVICPSTSLPLALRLDGGSPFSLSRSRARLSTGVADRQLSAA